MVIASDTEVREVWWRLADRRVRNLKLPWVPVFIMLILLVCAGFSPLVAPHDPTEINILDGKLAPGENLNYPLGTDILGRDMLSRLIYGCLLYTSDAADE